MRKAVLIFSLLVALAGGSAALRAADAPGPQPYSRIGNPDSNTVRLEIALRKFVPEHGAGPAVWLVGVMHIGEVEYYHALQKFLNDQTVVLYEGINPDAHPHHVHDAPESLTNAPAPAPTAPGTNSDYSMQSELARSLGLVFQLEAIDYNRTNFLNSDLSIAEIQRLMGESSQGTGPGGSFETLLQVMDGSSFLGSLVKMALHFMAASPETQGVVKLALIEAVGRLKGDLTDVQGMPPEWKQLLKVLIAARNKNLVSDLAEELKKVPSSGSVAVFYGAGHMDDMEKRVTGELHYHAAEEKWLPAFSVDMRKSGISPIEAQWIRNLMESQMDMMQGH